MPDKSKSSAGEGLRHSQPSSVRFQLAGIYKIFGSSGKAKDFFEHFLRAQDEFRPDEIETVFITQSGFDMARLILLAQRKAAESGGAFALFFGERPEERLIARFQETLNNAHDRYMRIWKISVPLMNLTEEQMFEQWTQTFASELSTLHKPSASKRKVERWSLALIKEFRAGCYSL